MSWTLPAGRVHFTGPISSSRWAAIDNHRDSHKVQISGRSASPAAGLLQAFQRLSTMSSSKGVLCDSSAPLLYC